MDKKVAENLVKARKAVKRKFEELQHNISTGETILQRKFKPISDPLNELLRNIKKEPVSLKTESPSIKSETPDKIVSPVVYSTPAVLSSKAVQTQYKDTPRPQRKLEFLKTHTVAEGSPEEETTLRNVDEDDDILSTDPLLSKDPKQIWEEVTNSDTYKAYIDQFGGIAKAYISGWLADVNKEYDDVYGPKREILTDPKTGELYDTGRIVLGKSEVNFSDDGKIIYITPPDGIKHPYEGTVALYELIFKNPPNRATVEKDTKAIKDYKDILERTSVHHVDADPEKQIRGNRGLKYLEFIKPIKDMKFSEDGKPLSPFYKLQKLPGARPRSKTLSSLAALRKGEGILQYNNKKIEYIPYKDPNSLINRLKVLLSSRLAGNNAHDNEITYIVEELKDIKVIK